MRFFCILLIGLLLVNPIIVLCNEQVQAIGEHNVGIANVVIDYAVTWWGAPSKINVTVVNYGSYSEIVNMTVFANTTIIGVINNLNLSIGDSRTLTTSWDGGILNYGPYVISAYVAPVMNETNIADNTCFGGTVIVTFSGDVDGNGVINVLDLIKLAMAIGKPWPPINPIYPLPVRIDINIDGRINVLDLILVARGFGTSTP